MALTLKRRLFVEYYLGQANGNATEAARLAGYAAPTHSGYRLLGHPATRALVDQRVETAALTANQVLKLLSEQARGTMHDFVSFDEADQPFIDLKRAEEHGQLQLIRKLSRSRDGRVEIELYDAQAALVHLGRHLKLWTDKVETTETGPVEIEYVNDWRG